MNQRNAQGMTPHARVAHPRRPRRRPLLASVLALAAVSAAHALPAPELEPYTARYAVSYRGLSGGEIESTFTRASQPGLWQYETRAFPNVFGRLAVSGRAHELSTLQVTPTGVRPLSFSFDDGAGNRQKDVRLSYDWTRGMLTGSAEGKPLSYEIEPGTQDTASVQAAMIRERLAGRKPSSFRIVANGKLREYRYWLEGTQKVTTPLGTFEAEVWANAREGSNRVSKVWHAPELGFVPVQAIQYRKGNPEVQMKLVKLERK